MDINGHWAQLLDEDERFIEHYRNSPDFRNAAIAGMSVADFIDYLLISKAQLVERIIDLQRRRPFTALIEGKTITMSDG